jgi:hypothetical protein
MTSKTSPNALSSGDRTPYHRFGPQIERLNEKAEAGTRAFNEAMQILQSIKNEV